jgi:tetratricopeptide (TPR) repeat protein
MAAETYLALGRFDEARGHATEALEVARKHPSRGWEAWALKVLADVRAAESARAQREDAIELGAQTQADREKAAELYGRALAMATDLGLRPLAAHCHAGLAKQHERSGRPREARAHLEQAVDLYQEMEMRFWLERLVAPE